MTAIMNLMALAVLALTGCAATEPAPCIAGTGKPVLVYELYFGRTIGANGLVSDASWTSFRDTTITANLPDGYTVLDADGAWAAPGGHRTIANPTKVLIVALPNGSDGLAAIDRIRLAYQHRFAQQLVGMIVQPGCALF